MIGKIKKVGLMLGVALALAVVLAPTAVAQFTSSKEHTIVTGSQTEGTNHVFTSGEGFGGISCETVIFSGTATSKSESSQEIYPVYAGCKDTFGRTIHIDNPGNALKYTFTTNGTAHVSGGMTMTVTSGGAVVCTIVIKAPQTNNGITYENLGGTSGIRITTHTTNVVSTTSGGFFNCGVGNGEHIGGSYDGVTAMTGKDTTGAAAAISVD